MKETLLLQFDGGSRGNPGPAGIGIVVSAADGTPLVTLGRFIGTATNNVAEYRALITAIEEAKKLGATDILIRGDSELVIKQMKGICRVKHPDMQRLHAQAQALLRTFAKVTIEHNLRHKNELADKLANLAMDRRVDVTDADGPPARPVTPVAARPTILICPTCDCTLKIINPGSGQNSFVCCCGTAMDAKV